MGRRAFVGWFVAGLALAACGGGDSAETTVSSVAATTTTTAPITTTTTNVPVFSSDDALSVTDGYYEAYNAGDVEAVLALFEPDATLFDMTRAFLEELLVWNAAQGTALSPPDCTVTSEVSGAVVTVSCRHDNLDALVQAVDGPPVPIKLTLTVTPDGISDWVRTFGQPDFNTVGIPFDSWMMDNHPEDVDNLLNLDAVCTESQLPELDRQEKVVQVIGEILPLVLAKYSIELQPTCGASVEHTETRVSPSI